MHCGKALSGRTNCRACGGGIDKGALRYRLQIGGLGCSQGPGGFNFKPYFWLHAACFRWCVLGCFGGLSACGAVGMRLLIVGDWNVYRLSFLGVLEFWSFETCGIGFGFVLLF